MVLTVVAGLLAEQMDRLRALPTIRALTAVDAVAQRQHVRVQDVRRRE